MKMRPPNSGNRNDKRLVRSRLSDFAKRLLAEWQRLALPNTGQTIVVAVSGGADSTALFLALDEALKAKKLSVRLVVAHLDHGLRKASKGDAEWVSQVATEFGYEAVIGRANVKRRALNVADNLEQAARRARYEFLKRIAKRVKSTMVLTAHTLDDQAETILMRLLRGSAAEGLSGTESIRPLDAGSKIELARPLLSWARRSDTEGYCSSRSIDFRTDEMNNDDSFARVRVRKQLLPLMQSFNNKIVEALARTASLLREDAAALSHEANKLLLLASKNASQEKGKNNLPLLSVDVLAVAPAAVRRRALRRWLSQGPRGLRRVEMVHLLAVERLLEGSRGGRVAELPDGTRVARKRGWLELSVKKVEKAPSEP